jgi:Flp pilus assembly pilin Flp
LAPLERPIKPAREFHSTRRSNLHEAIGYLHVRVARACGGIRRFARAEPGQGTVEYVALVLLIALVMFGVVTAMKTYKFGEGQELGDLIVNKIKEAVSKVRY